MNLRRIVYDFLISERDKPANTAIFDTEIQADRYEEVKNGGGAGQNVWIRLDNIKRYETRIQLGQIKQINAPVEIQIIVRPVTQNEIDRREAEERVTRIALELVMLFDQYEKLNDTSNSICNTATLGGLEEWIKIANVRHATGYVVLVINPVKT